VVSMFEYVERKSISDARRITMLLVSVILHVTMIILLIVLPLVYFNVLPQQEILTYLLIAPPQPPPPLAPPPPPPEPRVALSQPRSEVTAGFTAPNEIPKTLPQPNEEPIMVDVPKISEGEFGGVPGGVLGGVPSGIQGMIVVPGPLPLPPPPPPPLRTIPKPSAPLAVSSFQQQSKLIRMVPPTYPLMARQARIQGTVLLHVVVDEEGNVIEADVVSGHPLLLEAAISAVKQWKYSPTILNNKPVQVATTVNVIFTLQGL
jgi:periplasmic protein TonB